MAETKINYTEKTTQELLDLLVTEEDRVTLEHMQELVARPDAIAPLRAWLTDRNRWKEAKDGEWWAFYHAFTILSLTRRAELLDDLLLGYRYANEEDFDWLVGICAPAFAQFGAAAVEPLMQFVTEQRTRPNEEWFVTSMRSFAVTALTRIALEVPDVQPRVADFVISRFTDLAETDPAFLGLLTGHALLLDYDHAKAALRQAFEREAVDEQIAGNYEETVHWYDTHSRRDDPEYSEDLLKFYQPAEIEFRQVRWQDEREEAELREQELKAKEIAHRLGWDVPDEPAIPKEGYIPTITGTVVREEAKVGRNDPCPCGSGKKYKKCCGA
jgi:hypothetical protein